MGGLTGVFLPLLKFTRLSLGLQFTDSALAPDCGNTKCCTVNILSNVSPSSCNILSQSLLCAHFLWFHVCSDESQDLDNSVNTLMYMLIVSSCLNYCYLSKIDAFPTLGIKSVLSDSSVWACHFLTWQICKVVLQYNVVKNLTVLVAWIVLLNLKKCIWLHPNSIFCIYIDSTQIQWWWYLCVFISSYLLHIQQWHFQHPEFYFAVSPFIAEELSGDFSLWRVFFCNRWIYVLLIDNDLSVCFYTHHHKCCVSFACQFLVVFKIRQ